MKKMKNLRDIILVTIFYICSSAYSVKIDLRLAPYVQEYEREIMSKIPSGSAKVRNILVMFDTDENIKKIGSGQAVGICSISVGGVVPNTIRISERFLEHSKNEKTILKLLMYHELTHCVYGINGHTKNTILGIRTSIMNPYQASDADIHDYKLFYWYYHWELIQRIIMLR